MTGKAALPALVLILAFGPLLSACGVSAWPQPVKGEDTISFAQVRADRQEGCLIISLQFKGDIRNVDTLFISYQAVGEGPGEACPTCPFNPRDSLVLESGDPARREQGSTIQVTLCNLSPDKVYLWRAAARNRYPSLGTVMSPIYSSWPK